MTFCAAPNGTTCAAPTILPVQTFLTFAAHPNLVFELDAVPNNGFPMCTPTWTTGTCSIYINGSPSPVFLTGSTTFQGGASAVGIDFSGVASDAGTGGLHTLGNSTWGGSYSATIQPGAVPGRANSYPGDILLYFCPSGTCTSADIGRGTVLSVLSVSGTFSATIIPEPSTASLVLIGGALVAVGLKKVKRGAKG
jgi:hypothetical protein